MNLLLPLLSDAEEVAVSGIARIIVSPEVDRYLTQCVDTIFSHGHLLHMWMRDASTKKVVCCLPNGQLALGTRRRTFREWMLFVLDEIFHTLVDDYIT